MSQAQEPLVSVALALNQCKVFLSVFFVYLCNLIAFEQHSQTVSANLHPIMKYLSLYQSKGIQRIMPPGHAQFSAMKLDGQRSKHLE